MRNTLYILVAFILASTWHQASAQGEFYNVDEIQEVKIYFQQKNWDHLLDSFYVDGQKERLLGAVELNGTYFDSVGIRYKGFSSVSVDRKKNPFNIKLDYVKNQSYQGIDKVKLSNVIQDPSFLREVLSYNIARDYMPASQANFANVYINDTLWGLYTNVESVNKEFLIQHFPSTDNAFFKCNPEDLDFDGENSNLGDSPGMDSTEYFDLYDMRSDHGWSKLLKLIDHLNQSPERIEDVLNVDRALWMHAFNYVLINFDSYVGYAQNYYLYEDDFGIFHPIIWDLNMSFASFRFTDASEHFDGFSIREAINMDPLLHYTSVSIFPRPLMRNLFSDDTYRRMYLAHMRTILNDHFQSGAFYAKASDWKALISPHVLADTNKFYTDEDFNENIDTAVSDLIDYPGIKQLMEGRINYLMDYPGIKDPPAITDVMHAPDRPSHNDMVFITAKIEGASDVRMYSRDTQGAPFTWNAMFDDGLHGDGAAGDGVYGIDLNFASRPLEYYIYAENDDAGVFSPQSAAYKFFHIRGQTEPDELVINEIMSSNSSTVSDELGEFDDWIEIYNTTEDSISTSGLYLSDDSTAKFKWAIPDTVIPGGDYLLIWADGDTGQGKWHSNFRLSSLGESLYMTSIDSQVIDQVDFPMLQSDVSYGRYPNGTGPFQSMTPTPNSENLPDLPDDGKTLTVAPNPCTTSELSLSRSHAEGKCKCKVTRHDRKAYQ